MTILEFDIANFGDVIRERRLDLRLTQKELASLAGVTDSTILHLERGEAKPLLESVLKICKALQIDEVRIDTTRELKYWERRH